METALDSLVAQLEATATDVNNVTNQFLCLSNTQFLENRVYDDDDDDDDGDDDYNMNSDYKGMCSEEKKEVAKVRAVMSAL
jgi:WASH complex subunit FAM21